MKKVYFIGLLAVCLILNSKILHSQFINPISSDIVACSVYDFENTGNDVRSFSGANYDMRIMCWDGRTSGFYWDDQLNNITGVQNIYTPNYGDFKDPDIVLYDDGDMKTLITYIYNNDVFYEVWDYNGSTWNLQIGPNQLSSSGNCVCPNVDIDYYGKVVIVWEETGNSIWASAGDIYGNFGPEVYIADGISPDISLNVDPSNPPTNIVFLQPDGGTGKELAIFETYHDEIYNDNITLPNHWPIYGADYNTLFFRSKPRIASPLELTQGNFDHEWEIVVSFEDNGNFQILGSNTNDNGPYVLNDAVGYDITGEENYEPVVSYCGDYIVVVWSFWDDNNPQWYSGTVDILSRLLPITNGIPNNTPPYVYYSVVNTYQTGTQSIPSVAGRFSYGPKREEKLVTWFEMQNAYVRYKSREDNQTQFRLKKPDKTEVTIDADIYPNPTSGYVNINIDNEFETGKLEVYNIQGQLILQKEFVSQEFELDLSTLNTGIYKLRLIIDNKSEIKTIEVL